MSAVFRSRKFMLAVAITLGAADCAFVATVLTISGLDAAAAWATIIGLPVAIAAAIAAFLALSGPKAPVPPELAVEDWIIDRPAELTQIVTALTSKQHPGNLVAVTTALTGAGGFGKTTLAKLACTDPKVRHHYHGQIHFITIGRDVRGDAAIANKVNDVIHLLGGPDAPYTNPEQADQRLGTLLDDGTPRSLVLDDIWEPEQLHPFTTGGKQCVRLITTRVSAFTRQAAQVQVDQMSPTQAHKLLTAGLPSLDQPIIDGLLDVTGNWPLLLRLANKILANTAAADKAAVSHAAALLLARLRADGPAAADHLLSTSPGLDIGNPKERDQAVQATINASRHLLTPADACRFNELAIFAEDETIPLELIATLWTATSSLTRLETDQTTTRIARLALITIHPGTHTSGAGVTLHDVIRDLLRAETTPAQLAKLNQTLLTAVSASLPPPPRSQEPRPIARRPPGGKCIPTSPTSGTTSSNTSQTATAPPPQRQ